MDRRRPAVRRSARVLLLAAPVGFLLVFFLYPVASIVALGLAPSGELQLDVVAEVAADPVVRRVAWFTLWQAAVSTVATVVVALPGAYVLARYDFRGRRLVSAAVTVPFVLPTVVVGAAFLTLLRPTAAAGSVWPIVAAHVFFNYAVVVRTVGGLWAHLDPSIEEAAQALGATRTQTLRTVTLPLLRPAIAAAAAIVFLFTFTSFGVVLILGQSRVATLEVEIYRQTAQLLNLPVASVLALLQMAAVAAVLVVYRRWSQRRAVEQRLRSTAATARRPTGARERLFVAANLSVMAVLLGVPLAVLVERSVSTPHGYGLDWYVALATQQRGGTLFVPPMEAIRNSLLFGAAATLLAVVLGGLAAFAVTRRGGSGVVDTLLMLPLGTSAVTVGFGFLIALDTPPLDLRASPLLVPCAHALVAMPFVVRTVAPVLASIDERLRAAAAVLGASPARVWREVDLPIVARALLVAAGFAFAVSLGEFGATIFIARADWPTMPIAIYRFLGQPGAANVGQAMALSTILMVVTAAAVAVIEHVRVGRVGEF